MIEPDPKIDVASAVISALAVIVFAIGLLVGYGLAIR